MKEFDFEKYKDYVLAISNNDIDCVKKYLALHEKVDVEDHHLFGVARAGAVELFEALLPVLSPQNIAFSVLLASSNNRSELVSLLLPSCSEEALNAAIVASIGYCHQDVVDVLFDCVNHHKVLSELKNYVFLNEVGQKYQRQALAQLEKQTIQENINIVHQCRSKSKM